MKKENKELQQCIKKSAVTLGKKIVQLYKSGVDFDNIYNAENIKYDKHGNYFTYKGHGANKSQIRLLYYCRQSENTTNIFIIDYIEKRKTGKKGHKDHLDKFSKYANVDFSKILDNIDIVDNIVINL